MGQVYDMPAEKISEQSEKEIVKLLKNNVNFNEIIA